MQPCRTLFASYSIILRAECPPPQTCRRITCHCRCNCLCSKPTFMRAESCTCVVSPKAVPIFGSSTNCSHFTAVASYIRHDPPSRRHDLRDLTEPTSNGLSGSARCMFCTLYMFISVFLLHIVVIECHWSLAKYIKSLKLLKSLRRFDECHAFWWGVCWNCNVSNAKPCRPCLGRGAEWWTPGSLIVVW